MCRLRHPRDKQRLPVFTKYGCSVKSVNNRKITEDFRSANENRGRQTRVIYIVLYDTVNEGVSVRMLPFETDILLREVTKNCYRVMPRVVPDQRTKFDNDELFRKLSREGEIKYTGFRDRPVEERQLRFQTECREGHADLACVATGTNLHLQFTPNSWSENAEDRVPTQEFVDFDREPGKVHLKSQFILNGVCVLWKGWLDLHRLDGIGAVEYDEERANVEDSLLRQQIDQYNRQLRDFEDRQRHYREEQERRAEAEAEEYHRLLRTRVEMLEKSHPLFLLGLERAKRGTSTLDNVLVHRQPEKKRLKKCETTVQVPVPVKPAAASSAPRLDSLCMNLAAGASASLSRPRLTHTVPSLGLVVSNPAVTRLPIATRSSIVTSCPVKLYPWKPNMYIV